MESLLCEQHPEGLHEEVIAFHQTYDQPIVATPSVPSLERILLRAKLHTEEFFELLEAFGLDQGELSEAEAAIKRAIATGPVAVNLREVTDALADHDFISEGTRLECGIPGREVGAEVAYSNTTKLGADGKPVVNDYGKVVKGPAYQKPRITEILRRHGWNGEDVVVLREWEPGPPTTPLTIGGFISADKAPGVDVELKFEELNE